MKYNFEDIIKEKANSFEFEYDPKEWSKLNKKLNGSNPFSIRNISIFSIIISATIISSVFIYNSTNKNIVQTTISNNSSINESSKTTQTTKNTNNSNSQINTKNNETNKTDLIESKEQISSISITEKNNSSTLIDNKSIVENYTENSIKNTKHNENNFIATSNIEQSYFALYQSVKEGCTPFDVDFNSTNSIENATYTWDFGDGNTSEGFSVSHNYKTSGIFKVTLIVKHGNNTFSYNSIVNSKESPNSDFSWTNTNKTYSFKSNYLEAFSYEWKINKGEISTNDTFEKEFLSSDIYQIELTTRNSNGCSSTTSKPIKIDIEYFQMPNSFTPNGDGYNDLYGPIGEELSNLNYHFIIYDKSGNILFETDNPNKKWDGINYKTSKPATTTTDVFIWKVIIKDSSEKEQIKTGTVTIFVN